MDLTQENINLIEKIIKSNTKFSGNEDLYDDFFNEMCKRSLPIIRTITSDDALEAYLKKLAITSILNVLKSEGRLQRTKNGYKDMKTVSLDEDQNNGTDYSQKSVKYEHVDIQETPEDVAIKKDILQQIVDSVREIDKKSPEKQYFKLYNLRFVNGFTQNEIAQEMGLSQSEVSKRLFKLMNEVRQTLG